MNNDEGMLPTGFQEVGFKVFQELFGNTFDNDTLLFENESISFNTFGSLSKKIYYKYIDNQNATCYVIFVVSCTKNACYKLSLLFSDHNNEFMPYLASKIIFEQKNNVNKMINEISSRTLELTKKHKKTKIPVRLIYSNTLKKYFNLDEILDI